MKYLNIIINGESSTLTLFVIGSGEYRVMGRVDLK